ncbi:unnamed protein product [Danaus chrysippus]|uniref:(African queen) hypothetical protein n=1 Tax=Danaus chrysippus TaxID=151541 RepID=A0A8J2R823_9NEOP|nr:unnamed protein product [Danaus chrysippus]
MLADVFRSLQKPSFVIAMTCWTAEQKLMAYSELAGSNVENTIIIKFVESANILHNKEIKHHTVFFTDLNCPKDRFNANWTDPALFRFPYRWVIIDKYSGHQSTIPDVIRDIDVLIDSEVAVIRRINDASFQIYYVFKIGPNTAWRNELYGTWNESGMFKTESMLEVTALRRINLNKYEISICYVLTDNDSINHLADEVNDHIDTITKVNFPTTNQLLDFLNASRRYVFTNTWGYKHNDTWSGMTGFLDREEVDIGGSPMFLTGERLSVVEYISSPTPTRSKFVFQQPKLSYENNLFVLSFKRSLWFGSVILISMLFLFLFLVTVWEWKRTSIHKRTIRTRNAGILRPNVVDVALLIFGATCQQGSTVELKGSLGRMVLFLLFIMLTFLYTSYSANIVALLQSSSSQIRTLEDLLHSRINFGVHDTVFNRYYFSTETEPIRRAIYEKKVAPPGTTPRFMTMEEGVQEIRKGLFAFHMETGVGYKFVGKYFEEGEKCGLKEIQYLRVIDPWLAVRKQTPFKEMFKIGTKRLQEHGLQQRENRLLYEKKPKCSGRQANFISVSMVDCYPAILILSYGTLISISVLLAENLYYNLYKYMPKGNWKIETFGTWTNEMGLNKVTAMNIPISQRRRNLEGTEIGTSMVVNDNDTRMDILSMRNLNTDHLTKAGYRQILPLYYFMNATLVTVFTDTWGYLRNGSYDGMIGETPRSPHLDISEITMMVIGAITQQGSFTEFKGTLGRVVMFLMFFVFLFLHTSYSANIVALLQSSSNDIKTLADLLNSKLELGAEDTPYNRQHLSTASEPIRKAIYEKKIAPAGSKPNFMTLEEGVKRIQTKPFAFHMYLGGGYRLVEKYFLEHEKCGLQEIQFNHETIPWVTCRKNSPYKEIFKIGLLRNQEHGLNDRVNRLIYSRKPICSVHGGTFGSVNMTDFYPALLMLVYGMIASLLLLAIECLASQRLCHLRNRIHLNC